MKSSATPNLPDAIYSSLQSAHQLLLNQEEAGPPELPPELERQIFETCAFNYPRIRTKLVLVSKAVYAWIDPILISTVCITEDPRPRRQGKIKSFFAKLISGKNPAEYYARHVKDLALFGGSSYSEREVNVILRICSGVENLVIKTEVRNRNFFNNLKACKALSRLYIDYWKHCSSPGLTLHACFRNLTHLHLADNHQYWAYYTGWEHLSHLTHLAFESSSSEPDKLGSVIQVLPAIQYVALGFYYFNRRFPHNGIVVNDSRCDSAAWATRVVILGNIPPSDWKRGARGKGDFCDVVEKEVQRRLRQGSS